MKQTQFYTNYTKTAQIPYYINSTDTSISYKNYICSPNDDNDWGTVEPCAGTDVPDTETAGIAIQDTDGEWIEMKNNKHLSKLSLKPNFMQIAMLNNRMRMY